MTCNFAARAQYQPSVRRNAQVLMNPPLPYHAGRRHLDRVPGNGADITRGEGYNPEESETSK
jgi:hypothetical protein